MAWIRQTDRRCRVAGKSPRFFKRSDLSESDSVGRACGEPSAPRSLTGGHDYIRNLPKPIQSQSYETV